MAARVDVLIPTKGEPLDVLEYSFIAASALEGDRGILILDDAARSDVKALADRFGFAYLARGDAVHAKAGNLNAGLAQTSASFVAVLDADHAPLPTMLIDMLTPFGDDRVAFVQGPQHFRNRGSFMHGAADPDWTEQSLWFGAIQPGRETWNAVACCGSPAIFRRAALDEIGGFATGTITEDLHTSLLLHKRGWRGAYHNRLAAWGLAPEGLAAFSAQRLRWGRGAFDVWRRERLLREPRLTWPQRLSYLASVLYYFSGIARTVLYAAPPLALVFGVAPLLAPPDLFFAIFLAQWAFATAVYLEFARGTGRIVQSEVFAMVSAAPSILSLASLAGDARRFTVTPKSKNARAFTPWLLFPLAVLAAQLAGLAAAVATWADGGDPLGNGLAAGVLVGWSLWNAIFASIVIVRSLRQ